MDTCAAWEKDRVQRFCRPHVPISLVFRKRCNQEKAHDKVDIFWSAKTSVPEVAKSQKNRETLHEEDTKHNHRVKDILVIDVVSRERCQYADKGG